MIEYGILSSTGMGCMEKIWLKSYQPGVPDTIDPDHYASLAALFLESCGRYADKPALMNYGSVLSYQQWEHYSGQLAAYFQQVLGLEKGDRIAFMMPNCLQYPVLIFAALRAGLVITNINPLYTDDELVVQINDAACRALVVLDKFASTVQQALPQITTLEHIIVTQLGDLFGPIKGSLFNFVAKYIKRMSSEYDLPKATTLKAAIKQARHLTLEPVTLCGDDVACLQYTGGTTGVAKGAELTHRNLLANLEQTAAWLAPSLKEGEEVIITALPLYHIFALTANCLLFLRLGALNILITNPRDLKSMIDQIKKTQFTCITGVNTLFNGLLHHSQFKYVDFSHLKMALGGGMAVQKAVAQRWQKVTGCVLREAYGLTETSPAVAVNPMHLTQYNGSIGLPIPSTDVAIRDTQGHDLPIGEAGELCVKGPQVMRAYWRNLEETKKVLSDDGWLRTGDIAKMDEKGFIYIVDRIKDMILVSGFNVYPNEIEDVLVSHPDIIEAGVVGVSHKVSGEMVKAFLVSKNTSLTKADVIAHCREHLTSYKIPKEVVFVSELPKSNVGKILRRELRDEASSHSQ